MANYYAVSKLINGSYQLWWVGHNPEAAYAEFDLCHQYGGGAKLRVFRSLEAYHADRTTGAYPQAKPAAAPAPSVCANRMELPVLRGVNAWAVETGKAPMARCKLKAPGIGGTNVSDGTGAGRWLASGGSPLAFGLCSVSSCPLSR